jgi:hypothetical protein
LPIARYYHHDLYIVSCPAHHPAVIRFLMLGRQVRSPRDVDHGVNDLLVVPARWELGLAGNARAMAMPAAAVRVAIEYVGGPFRGDVNVLGFRPVLGINRIPPRTIPVGRPTAIISRLTLRSGPEHLVVLLATTRLGRLRPPRGNIASRLLPPGPVEVVEVVEVVVRPV